MAGMTASDDGLVWSRTITEVEITPLGRLWLHRLEQDALDVTPSFRYGERCWAYREQLG